MDKITVSKTDLLDTLRTNRADHKAEYDTAVEVYRERFVAEAKAFAKQATKAAAAGEDFDSFPYLPIPEEHTEDFDRAIAMLEWDQADTVELTRHEFSQYVQNNWDFAAITISYSAGR